MGGSVGTSRCDDVVVGQSAVGGGAAGASRCTEFRHLAERWRAARSDASRVRRVPFKGQQVFDGILPDAPESRRTYVTGQFAQVGALFAPPGGPFLFRGIDSGA